MQLSDSSHSPEVKALHKFYVLGSNVSIIHLKLNVWDLMCASP